MTIAKAIARVWSDADYESKLLNNPHAALADAGVEIPTGTTLQVPKDPADTRHIVLPAAPDNAGEMSTDELEKVAGGRYAVRF